MSPAFQPTPHQSLTAASIAASSPGGQPAGVAPSAAAAPAAVGVAGAGSAGRTPSCWRRPTWSNSVHDSTTRPHSTRKAFSPCHVALRPVGGMPCSAPSWTPVAVQWVTTQGASVRTRSTVHSAFGKAAATTSWTRRTPAASTVSANAPVWWTKSGARRPSSTAGSPASSASDQARPTRSNSASVISGQAAPAGVACWAPAGKARGPASRIVAASWSTPRSPRPIVCPSSCREVGPPTILVPRRQSRIRGRRAPGRTGG